MAILSIQTVSIQIDLTLQKRLQFTWLTLVNINSLTVIPEQKYNISKLYRGLELQSEKLGELVSILGINGISLTSTSLYAFAEFVSPFLLSRLFFFSELTPWLAWPLDYNPCCSITITALQSHLPAETDNRADVSLIKLLEKKNGLFYLMYWFPLSQLSIFNQLLTEWSCNEMICSTVVCFVGRVLY